MNKITVQKRARAKFVRLRLNPSVQHALNGIRKLYFNDRTSTESLAGHALVYALSHWNDALHRRILAERMYIWNEGIRDGEDFYNRKMEALWKT